VIVKGRDEPLEVYEVVGRAGALAPDLVGRLARYHEALAGYRERRWAPALALLDALAGEAPDDGPVALYRRRCAALLAEPPPADWNGVYVARTK
jgi:adenylate cyclase